MQTSLVAYFASLITLLVLDGTWLSLTSKSFYAKHLGPLMAPTLSLPPAVLFYPLYALALIILVVLPAFSDGTSLYKVFLLGALLGLAAYGAYDLTNQATLKNWPVVLTIVDMAWGTLVTGVVATIAVALTKYFS